MSADRAFLRDCDFGGWTDSPESPLYCGPSKLKLWEEPVCHALDVLRALERGWLRHALQQRLSAKFPFCEHRWDSCSSCQGSCVCVDGVSHGRTVHGHTPQHVQIDMCTLHIMHTCTWSFWASECSGRCNVSDSLLQGPLGLASGFSVARGPAFCLSFCLQPSVQLAFLQA